MHLSELDFITIHQQRNCRNILKSLFDIQYSILADHYRGANYVSGPTLESLNIAFTTATQNQLPSPFIGEEVLSLETVSTLSDTISTISNTMGYGYKENYNQCRNQLVSHIEQLTLIERELKHSLAHFESVEFRKSLITVPIRLSQFLHSKGVIDCQGITKSIYTDYSDQLHGVMDYLIKTQTAMLDHVTQTCVTLNNGDSDVNGVLNNLKSVIKERADECKKMYPRYTHSTTLVGNVNWSIHPVKDIEFLKARIPYVFFNKVSTRKIESPIEFWHSDKEQVIQLINALLEWIPKLIIDIQQMYESLSHFQSSLMMINTVFETYIHYTTENVLKPTQVKHYHRALLFLYGIVDSQNIVHLKNISEYYVSVVENVHQLIGHIQSQCIVNIKDH